MVIYMRKGQRIYLVYLKKAEVAIMTAVDCFNRVYGEYKTENTFILLANAWELLSKAILIKIKENIQKNPRETIDCISAIKKLRAKELIKEECAQTIAQIVSLRDCCVHSVLPPVSIEIQIHLLFYGCKFFKDVENEIFKKSPLEDNFLSISFNQLTTYTDKILKTVSKLKRINSDQRKLVWLLERGIESLTSDKMLSQSKFEKKYRNQKKYISHLKIKDYIDKIHNVRIVAIQAPKNYSADLILRKGDKNDNTLPVVQKAVDIDSEYPLFTNDIVNKLGKNISFWSCLIRYLGLKGNPKFHIEIKSSKKTVTQRYSNEIISVLKKFMEENPNYKPDYNKRVQKKGASSLPKASSEHDTTQS